MKTLIFSILLSFLSVTNAQTKVIELKSDKAVYAAGETAVLRANFFAKPDNTDFQFDIVSSLNSNLLEVDRVTDFQMFSSAKELVAGDYTWTVSVVVQDARYARDLKTTIQYYTNLIIDLDEQIAAETDPVLLANLQKRKDDAISLKIAAQSELNSIRTPVLAPVTLDFTVQ